MFNYGKRKGFIGIIIYFRVFCFFFFLKKKKREEVWREMIRRYWNINLKEMLEIGVYFGYVIRKWNLKMVFYIFVKCKGIYIINFIRIVCFLLEVCDLVFDVVSRRK